MVRPVILYTRRTNDAVTAKVVADWNEDEQQQENKTWGASKRPPIAVFSIGPAQNEEEARRRATALIEYIKRERATMAALTALEL